MLKCGCFWWVILVFGHLGKSDDDCDGQPVLISRKDWKARTPVRITQMRLPLNYVIIEHTADVTCSSKLECAYIVRFIQDYHMDWKGWWDIGYSFLIGGNGEVFVAHGWNETGAHAINFNRNSIGIAFMGNFMKDVPTNKSLQAVSDLIACGIRKGYLTPVVEVYGHRDVTCSASPGDNVYKFIRTWKNYKGGRMPDYDCSEKI